MSYLTTYLTRIKLSGPFENINRIVKQVYKDTPDGPLNFSFDKIKPQPYEIKGPATKRIIRLLAERIHTEPVKNIKGIKKLSKEDAIDLSKTITWLENTNPKAIRDWRHKNWGLFSEGFNHCYIPRLNVFYFQTGYTYSTSLIVLLSLRHPNVLFEVEVSPIQKDNSHKYNIQRGSLEFSEGTREQSYTLWKEYEYYYRDTTKGSPTWRSLDS